ncbi:MAG: trypsin-like peptidase domain-containing protein [Rhodobacteraceae bacterium]|nr:trypsin-like peptidase domain-containing protein [Paracoccaceae bacterium]
MARIILILWLMSLASIGATQTRVPSSQVEITLGFAPLVKQAAPAVVNIYAKIITEGRTSPFANDPFFEQFFGNLAKPRKRVQNSLGSGVILSAGGIVVSNYHVVGTATEIRVVTKDRREYNARVLLGDKDSDLAILQLEDAEGLPFLNLRDSDQVEVGELVLAIGNPFGIGQTVSSGIVSGLARSGAATGHKRGYFIQTDAAINPGNSGGALIDVNGALIGINTSILSRSGGSNGIGFAIPANLVREFVVQANMGNTSFLRPWAGMGGQPVDGDLAESLGLVVPEGILIAELHESSPFAKADFRVGDIITQVDGQLVNSPQEMLFRMSVAGIGGASLITRLRAGEVSEIEVGMILPPNVPPAQEIVLDDTTALPGLRVARANPAVIARFGLAFTTRGVVVADPGRFGQRAGLKTGDVILAINNQVVIKSDDVRTLLNLVERRVSMEIERAGRRIRLRFRL